MYTMSGIREFLNALIVRMVMEDEAVHDIFEECPKENAAKVKSNDVIPYHIERYYAVAKHGNDDRQVNAEDHLRAGFSE
jgi:hypothetical protein